MLGGPGGDTGLGGDGEDLLIGAGGGDLMDGARGADRLYGGLVDDQLRGGLGDDLLVGGHGVEGIHGGGGDDWMRGDSNRDFFNGDDGNDTVSYATSTPPGPFGIEGVNVNLKTIKALEDPLQPVVEDDEPEERVKDIENVVGSNYDDFLHGRGSAPRAAWEASSFARPFPATTAVAGRRRTSRSTLRASTPACSSAGGPGARPTRSP